jgi:CDP-diacylglycerol--glycerol-3-phosphate 3-phosphatidyltransferase
MQISAEDAARIRRPAVERFWNAPNVITLGRILAGPLVLLLALFPGRAGSLLIGFGFLAVSLTDLLDGWLARRDGSVTRIGKLLDPLADKILTASALVVLVAIERIPLWGLPLVLAILAREMGVTGLRAMLSLDGIVVPASPLAKWKTGFQSAALTALILHYPLLIVPTHELGMGLLVIATGLTLWSGWDYFAAYLGSRGAPGS